MPALPESASNKAPHGAGSARLVVVSLSWLGDCIMAMPALLALRKRLPGAHISVLAKPSVAPLWGLFPAVDDVILLQKGVAGTGATIRRVRKAGYDFAYVLPKSFRSAWIPFLARVPGRRGMSGHGRDWMLTETAPLSQAAVTGHQSLEMADVLHVAHTDLATPPFLTVPEAARLSARARIAAAFGEGAAEVVAFFPGAAYGPSKRWPAGRFAEIGRRLAQDKGCRILVLGSERDRASCEQVVAGIGGAAVNLAGQTGFLDLVGLLHACSVVLANDSGGMHLAAGLGVKVVGLFGLTDPVKTAPVGVRSRVLAADTPSRSRDLPRDSAAARAAMESISVDQVYAALGAN